MAPPAPDAGLVFEADATLTVAEVNAAYACTCDPGRTTPSDRCQSRI